MSSDFGEIKEISRRGAEELSVEWRIPNFPSLLNGSGVRIYESPTLRIGNECFHLCINPNWISGQVKLGLCRFDGGLPAAFRFSVGIRGSGGVEKSRAGEKNFAKFDHYGWYYFCSTSDLLEHRTTLMPHDTLTISCVLKRPGTARDVYSLLSTQVADTNRSQSSNKQHACTQKDCNLDVEVITGVKKSTEKRGGEEVVEDIAKLLASGEKSDVTVQVGDVEFRVHSLILFARCPALCISLQHESKERVSNRIVIEDCEPDVFREFLQHLYTGSVRSLTGQNVFDLYRVADKYLADHLKQLCLEHIQETLSVQTFCDTIQLALMHGESDLLQRATSFAAQNIQSILISKEWQNFNCENPRQANDILTKCFGA